MTMFIKLENGEPVGHAVVEENLRMLFPEVNFPKIFFPQDVEPYGFGIYEFTQVPEVPRFQKLVEGKPIKRDNGIFYQTWQFEPMTEEERNQATDQKSQEIRTMRNFKLGGSDWIFMPDVNLDETTKSAWLAYRQTLRDITAQPGFPWTIVWPAHPEQL